MSAGPPLGGLYLRPPSSEGLWEGVMIPSASRYRLDVSAGEDRCRVRHPVATTVLGTLLDRAFKGLL